MKGYVNLTHTNNSAIEEVGQKVDNIEDNYITKDTSELTNYYTKSQTYTKEEVDNKTTNVYRAKGSVQTYQDLPTTNNQVGDVYNVIEAYQDYPAGTNFVWTDTSTWDALGGEISVIQGVSQEDFDNLVNNETQIYKSNSRSFLAGNANTGTGYDCVLIGNGARSPLNRGVMIGTASGGIHGDNAICIGYSAKVNTNEGVRPTNVIQIGTGTNTQSNTLQIFDDNIYNHDTHTLKVQNAEINGTPAYGVLSSTSAPTTTTVGAVGQFYLDTTNKQLYQCMSITTETVDEVDTNVYEWTNLSQSGVSQTDFDNLVNNITQIESNNNLSFFAGDAVVRPNASFSVAIGKDASVNSAQQSHGVAVGYDSEAGQYGVGVGAHAKAVVMYTIQLGNGTNRTQHSFQIEDDNIYKTDTHTLTVNNIEQSGNPVYAVLQGTTAPDTTTVGAVTQFYLNTTTKKIYQCVSVTTSDTDSTTTYEWKEIEGQATTISAIELDDTLTSGTLTSEQLATLQESKTNYISYDNKIFKLTENTTSSLTYISIDADISTLQSTPYANAYIGMITVFTSNGNWNYREMTLYRLYNHNIRGRNSTSYQDAKFNFHVSFISSTGNTLSATTNFIASLSKRGYEDTIVLTCNGIVQMNSVNYMITGISGSSSDNNVINLYGINLNEIGNDFPSLIITLDSTQFILGDTCEEIW